MKYCKRCGAQLQDNAVTCFSCRAKQNSDSAPSVSSYQSNQNQPQESEYDIPYNTEYDQNYESDNELERPEYHDEPMIIQQPPKTPKWLIALIAGAGAVIIAIVIIIALLLNKDNDKNNEMLQIATEQYSVTSITTVSNEEASTTLSLINTTTDVTSGSTTVTSKTTKVSSTKRVPVIQTANTRRETAKSTTKKISSTTTTTVKMTTTTAAATTTEPPLQDTYIKISDKKILSVDSSLLGDTREELISILEINIPEPKEFTSYGTDLMSSSITYNGTDLTLMFQDNKLVMIVYDVKGTIDQQMLDAACEEFGLDASKYNTDDGIKYTASDGNTYQMINISDPETGDKHYQQMYIYSGIRN